MTHSFPTRRSSELKRQETAFVLGKHHGAGDDILHVLQGEIPENIGPAGVMGKCRTRAFLAVGEAGDGFDVERLVDGRQRSEEHTSELQSLMRNSYAAFCLKKKNTNLTQL